MKQFLVLVAITVVAVCLVAGCAGGPKTYSDPKEVISIGANQEFTIGLGSNPTTGYGWQASYEEAVLELVEKTYVLGEKAEQGVVGAAGTEYFRFKTLRAGSTRLSMTYKREWEEKGIERKIFQVNIK